MKNAPTTTLGKRVSERLSALGKKSSPVSKKLGFSDSFIRDIERKGVMPAVDKVLALASELETTISYLVGDTDDPRMSRQGEVRLTGYVGAGQEIYQFDEGDAGWTEAPPDASDSTQAVEVNGNSMLPLYEAGTVLYYSKLLAPEQMIGRRCIVRLEDERVLVKTLRRGSEQGLWTLVSLNADDIEDVAVEWVAPIDWIKPR